MAQNGKFSQFSYVCSDKISRPYIVYSPENIDSETPKPLLVYLHGSVSGPELKKDPLNYMKNSKLLSLAEKGGFYLLFSYGQKGATWFDATGSEMVLGEIKNVKNKFNINADKIFLSGFSDGGSGVFYLAMTHPFPFAGFIAMNGSINVAQKLGEKELFPENTNNIPLYIINTKNDMLYPINQIEPTVEYLKKYNPNITFSKPDGNHEMSYLGHEQDNLLNFINTHIRAPKTDLSWETTTVNENIEWLKILKTNILSTQKNRNHHRYTLKVFNDKADFGIKFDYSYQGKGLKVKGFNDDNATAKKMGVNIGDIITMMESDTIKSAYSPYYYTAKKKAGDATSLTVLRNNEEKTLHGKFNEGFYYNVFDSSDKTAKITAKIRDRKLFIDTSGISEFELDFDKLKIYRLRTIQLNDKPVKIKKKKGWVKMAIK